jgi:membrane fusion protein, heavy metal efflux system
MKYLTILLLALLFTNCHSHEHGDGHDHGEAPGEAAHPENEVALNAEQLKNIGIQYGKIENRKIQSKVKLTGRVELPPSGKSIASSALDGRITKVFATAGQTVRQGQPYSPFRIWSW